MEKKQRELFKKMNEGTLTKYEYEEVDKKLYLITTRIKMFKKYRAVLYRLIYIALILFTSIIISLFTVFTVNLAVR